MASQALIFAAGPAQRLMPLTEHRPKGMLIIGGRPLLQHAVEALREHGVQDVVLVVGHHGERIQAFFKDGADFGVRIRYVHQASPTGTMDAVRGRNSDCRARGSALSGSTVPSAATISYL